MDNAPALYPLAPARIEGVQGFLQAILKFITESLGLGNARRNRGKLGIEGAQEPVLPFLYPLNRNCIQIALGTGINQGNLISQLEWLILKLLEKFGQAEASIQLLLGSFVEIRTECGKCSQRTELREASERNCARSRRRPPATFFMAFV